MTDAQTNIVSPLHNAVQHVCRFGRMTDGGPYAAMSMAALVADGLPPGDWTAADVMDAAGQPMSDYRHFARMAGDLDALVEPLADYADRVQDMPAVLFAAQVELRRIGRADDADRVSVDLRQFLRQSAARMAHIPDCFGPPWCYLSRLQVARLWGCRLCAVNAAIRVTGFDPAILPALPVAEIRVARRSGAKPGRIAREMGLRTRDLLAAGDSSRAGQFVEMLTQHTAARNGGSDAA